MLSLHFALFYLLKVLLVGDSDVGKQEIISDMEDGTTDSPFCSSAGAGDNSISYLLHHFNYLILKKFSQHLISFLIIYRIQNDNYINRRQKSQTSALGH